MGDTNHDAIMTAINGVGDRLDSIDKHLGKINGRVYKHEQDKADKEELRKLRRIVWGMSIAMGGTGGIIGLKEIISLL